MTTLLPHLENARLEALRQYAVLDTPPEQAFDDLTHLAAQICGTPLAALTLIDRDRQWFKSRVGLEMQETPREISFCAHTILEPDLLLVPDTSADQRFADNPFVTSQPHIRFYAGAPLVNSKNQAVGALSVFDRVPRQLDPAQQDALHRLARQAIMLLETRLFATTGAVAPDETALLQSSEERYRRLFESAQDGILILGADSGQIEDVNPYLCQLLGYASEHFKGKQLWEISPFREVGPFRDIAANQDAFRQLQERKCVRYDGLPLETKDGRSVSVEFVSNLYSSGDRKVIQCNIRDISARKSTITEQERFFTLSLDMLCILDTRGYFKRINSAVESVLGFTAMELIGQSALDYIHPDDRADSKHALGQIAAGLQVINYVNRFRCRDGSYKSILWATAPYDNQFYAAGRDITERVRAEKKISFQAHLLNEVGQAVIATDMDGTVVYWNLYAEALYGWPAQEAMGKKANSLIVPEMQKGRAVEIRAHLNRGERWSGEFLVQRRNGTTFPAAVTNTPIYDEAGTLSGIIGVSKDISESKQTEQKLRESEERFQFIAATSGDALYQLRYDSLVYDYISPAITTLTGYSPEEINTIGFRHLIERVEGDTAFTNFPDKETRHRVREKREFRADYSVRTKSGESKWLGDHSFPWRDGMGKVIGSVGSLSDITERKRAESELKAREVQLAEAQQIAQLGSWEHNIATGVWTWSDELYRIFGAQPQEFEITSEALLQRVHPDDREFVHHVLTEPRLDQGAFEYHHRIVRPDGMERVLHERGVAIVDINGQIVRRFGTAQDVTELQQAQQSLQRLNDELEERVAQRTSELVQAKDEADRANAAKSEFLSRMSHELRTPLNAILGFSQILERQKLTPLQHESIGYILKGGRHLLGLINEVLYIARVEAGTAGLSIEPVALYELVSGAWALVQPLAHQSQLHFENNLSPQSTLHVMADSQRLKQVLLNLLSNAIKYNREGGEVIVSACEVESGRIQLQIQDTGTGLTPQNIQKLFTPFERFHAADSAIEGTGLGLVISQRLIEAMGGTLGVDSTPGQGSSFWIELPAADTLAPASSQMSGQQLDLVHPQADLTYTVLCIEDNPSNLRLIEAILEDRPDISLLSAMQGSIGLDLARQHEPDLILLDLDLPDVKGNEVLLRLQQSALTRDIPVVIVSADATPGQIERLLAAGARAYLTKPLDVGQFLLALDQFLVVPQDKEAH